MSLYRQALWIVENYETLGQGHDWRVEDVRWTWIESVDRVAKGLKPFTQVHPEFECEEHEIDYEDYYQRLQKLIKSIRGIPSVRGLDLWVYTPPPTNRFFAPSVLYGRPEHYQAFLDASDNPFTLESQALYGLVFGYPEEKIAAFLIRWKQMQLKADSDMA